MFNYSLFGLMIRSEVELPELFAADHAREADVTIRRGKVGPVLADGELVKDGGDALLLRIPDVASYRIAAGSEILVDAAESIPERNVRLYLLGSAFGVLLHQRGLLPLHANAIEIDGRAVAFMGPSGAGKSTLAAWFHDHGFKVIADDVCVIGFGDGGVPFVAPGLPRLRLWADALELTGRVTSGLSRSYVDEGADKFDVPMDPAATTQSHMPLAAIYVLDRGAGFSIAPLQGIDAANAVFANTYRGEYLSQTNGQKEHWEAAVRLVRGTPVFNALRLWDASALDEQCSRLLDHVRELTSARHS